MQNLLIASVLAVASAEAFYGYQLPASGLGTWPSTSYGYGSSSTTYGAHGYRIGKRSADPSIGYGIGYGIAHVALPTTLENRNNVHGHELASGYAISQPHPGAAGSFQQRTQLHSGYGKRSADPSIGYGIAHVALPTTLENRNNVHGHELASQYAISQPHPGFGGSYQQVSRLHSGLHYGGYYGKRSAEPFYGGVAVHPGHAVSSTHRSAQGLSLGYGHGYGYGHGFYGYGKRSADAFYGAATSAYAVNQAHPGYAGSYQHVSRLHSGIGYGYGAGYLY